jgi:hypothetical protein
MFAGRGESRVDIGVVGEVDDRHVVQAGRLE